MNEENQDPNTATAVAEVETSPDAVDCELILSSQNEAMMVLTDQPTMDKVIAHIRSETEALEPDLTTAKGREAIASAAYKVTRSKTFLFKARKELVSGIKAKAKDIDVHGKRINDELELLAKDTRRPLDEWEEAETLRQSNITAIYTLIDNAVSQAEKWATMSVTDILDLIDHVGDILIDRDLFNSDGEHEAAVSKRDAASATIQTAMQHCERRDADKAELEQLRLEKEQNAAEQAERERVATEEAERKERAEVAERQRVAHEKRIEEEKRRAVEEARVAAEDKARKDALEVERKQKEEAAASQKAIDDARAEEAEARQKAADAAQSAIAAAKAETVEAEQRAEDSRIAIEDKSREEKAITQKALDNAKAEADKAKAEAERMKQVAASNEAARIEQKRQQDEDEQKAKENEQRAIELRKDWKAAIVSRIDQRPAHETADMIISGELSFEHLVG